MHTLKLLACITALAWCPHLALAQHRDAPRVYNASISNTTPVSFSLFRRQNDEPRMCSEEEECEDKSCCANTGFCGLSEEHCNEDVCISNCDAKAECGSWAEEPGTECPLNVCCNRWGYCGMTEEFCNDECQSNCEQPPSTGLNTGDVLNLVIGYYEAWAPNRQGSCPKRNPDWIPTDSISHLNVAFAYIEPESFELYAMEDTSEEIFHQIMALKQEAPGLKIWVSLGGWTYSDNNTDTQPVWGDLSSTPAKRQKFIINLVNFMTNFGFDGVDLDWEYPGAPDRGGEDRDIENFVTLIREMRSFFDAQRNGWGISFTAPTSYWYMRWFNMGELAKHVDWINLMTYDLHGSWDSPESYIGSYVYAHTNLTEITEALNLLWRNDVPANKVNLGLGFYGRSYTLEDASCSMPGCPFESGGDKGKCTGESGILSYDEISAIYNTYNIDPVADDEAAVRYFAWGDNQWVSYDDAESIKQKVNYANEQGLLGIFIWALDLDTEFHGLLEAALDSKGGLGAFRQQNGFGPPDITDWTPATGQCYLSECRSSPACSRSYMAVGQIVRCGYTPYENRLLCCPRDNAPDPDSCSWRADSHGSGRLSYCNSRGCEEDEVKVVDSKWYWDEDDSAHRHCQIGRAHYCCASSLTARSSCGKLEGACIDINDDGQPSGEDPCGVIGRKFATYSQDSCPTDRWRPWCCEEAFSSDECHWAKWVQDDCDDVESCPANEINMGVSKKGEGTDCNQAAWFPGYGRGGENFFPRAWCCPAGEQSQFDQVSPVPLEWLFVDRVPESDDIEIQMKVQAEVTENQDPNENGFGWVIMTGPEEDLISVDKRDGSHWELFDCPDRDTVTEDHQITVRAVCVNDSPESNCAALFNGGVARTVVEMPEDCGIGRYAMAVDMVKSQNQTVPPVLVKRLAKRDDHHLTRGPPRVYDFTFDYDFSVLHGRDDSDVQIRVDYSEDASYWEAIVDNDPANDPAGTLDRRSNRRREMRAEVERDHGGSWKRYAEHTFRKHRRETPKDQMHHLNRRWFAENNDLDDWMVAMQAINEHEWEGTVDLPTHHVQDTFPFWLFNENLDCDLFGIPYNAYFSAWADLHVDIRTSAQVTLIGRLNDLSSWKQSHILFRNKGSIQAGIHMEAQATVRFSTGQLELFGMDNFGAAFTAPGIVTIGPNLRVLGELTGVFTAHTQAHYDLEVTSWDYTQRYPNPDNDILSGLTDTSGLDEDPGAEQDPDMDSPFSADVTVNGDITARVIPIVEFGIRWNPRFEVSDTTVSLRCDTHATLYGSAGIGTDIDNEVCYGAVAGAEIYAQVQAPTILGVNPNRRWSFYKLDVDIIEEKCYPLESFLPSDECEGCS